MDGRGMTETTEIVKAPKAELVVGDRVAPIIPRTVEEVARVANAVILANMAPDSYEGRTPEETRSKIMIGIMKGAEVGLAPVTALSTIMIVNKRACIWGDGAVALVQRSGELEYIKEWFEGTEGQDDWTAHCEMKRKGQDEVYKRSFSVADAKRAKLWGNPKKAPWMMYPQRMMQMRARSWCIRDGFADCLAGLSIREEIEDIPAPVEIDKGFLEDAPQIEAETVEPEAKEIESGAPPPWAAFTDSAVLAMKKAESMDEIQKFHGNHLRDIEALPDMAREMYDNAKREAVERLSQPQDPALFP